MNTFKRKALFAAVAALGAAGSAEAVYLSPNNTGQVLIYPYYTVQSAQGASWNTYLSVVNTTSRAKAVKVRILEGKTSAEVLDFNLFLSANDVWTAAIIPSSAATGAPGHILTQDLSCVNPGAAGGGFPSASGVDFRNTAYATGSNSLPGTGLDRTREGYVEMIEMGILSGAWATAVTHVSDVPANCAVVQGATLTPSSIAAPQGGLMGTGTLINVNNGMDAGYKADALEAFRNAPDYTDAGFLTPTLGDALPPTSLVINSGGIDVATGASTLITAYRSDFTGVGAPSAGDKAVASLLMRSAVMNEYVLDQNSASTTDWVLTQPLKNHFVTNLAAVAPYTNTLTSSGACETIGFTFFNREESGASAGGVDFSPLPPAGAPNSLCWESNVLSVRNPALTQFAAGGLFADNTTSTVLGSVNLTNVNVRSAANFQNGWAILTFTGANALPPVGLGSTTTSDRVSLGTNAAAIGAPVTGQAVTFFGLPVTGFMVRTFRNGNLTCGTGTCQGNYASLFNHSYRLSITP